MPYLFETHTLEQQRKAISDYLPIGVTWGSKNVNTSVIFNLLLGLANEFTVFESIINEISYEYDINTTTLLIDQWEKALGIPDSCLTNINTSIEKRRAQCVFKIGCKIDIRKTFIDLAFNLFGITADKIQIFNAGFVGDVYTFTYPWTYGYEYPYFTMLVHLPASLRSNVYPMTYTFTYSSAPAIECVFNYLVPASVRVIYIYDL